MYLCITNNNEIFLNQKPDPIRSLKMEKAVKIQKLQRVDVPLEFQEKEGCVAFQMVKFTYTFYGSEQTDTLDTKIMKDGSQIVIGGNGFIKHGFEII